MRTIPMIRTFPHTITFVLLTFLRRTGVNPDAVSLCATPSRHTLSLSPLSSRVVFWALMATAIANGGGVVRHFAHHASRQRSSSQESLAAQCADAHGVADGRFVTVLDFGTPSLLSSVPSACGNGWANLLAQKLLHPRDTNSRIALPGCRESHDFTLLTIARRGLYELTIQFLLYVLMNSK